MNNRTSKLVILVAVVFTLCLVIYGIFFAGQKTSRMREQIGTKLEAVEACYPIAFDSLHLKTAEGRHLKQLNDTVTTLVQLYRQQLDIVEGRAQMPADVPASARSEWRQEQLRHLASMEKSVVTLATYLTAQGRKAGHREYDMVSVAHTKLARENAAHKRGAEQSFYNEDFLDPDVPYFDYLISLADMVKARLAAISQES